MQRYNLLMVSLVTWGLLGACSDTGEGPGDTHGGIDAGLLDVGSPDGLESDGSDASEVPPPDISGTGFAYLVIEPSGLAFGH